MILTTNRFLKYIAITIALLVLAFGLTQVFSGDIILPQFFNIGPLQIHYYGIIMAVAVAAGFYLAIKRAPQYGIDLKLAEDLLFWLIIGGFIGARAYHVLSDIGYYYRYPADAFKVWNGGLSIYGSLVGGLLVLYLYFKLLNLRFSILNFLDWLAPSLLLGQIIGRFGNLFNYEAFGYPTNLPWKMFVPVQFRPRGFINYNFFHPFFLYEILGNLIIFFVLMVVVKKGRTAAMGYLFFLYVLLYNSLRFCLEFLRIDSTFISTFRLNAIVSLGLVFIGIIGLLLIKKMNKN